jgi:hypothetical protein
MTEIILFFIGSTFILKYGAPTKFIRDFFSKWSWGKNLFECALCIGTWVGLLSIPFLYKEIDWFTIPPIAAIVSWFGDLISGVLINLKKKLENE